jgi:hypothetical protein
LLHLSNFRLSLDPRQLQLVRLLLQLKALQLVLQLVPQMALPMLKQLVQVLHHRYRYPDGLQQRLQEE